MVTATNLGLLRANAETLHSVRTAPGGGEKFSDGEILKTTTVGSLQYDDYYAVLLSRAPVRSNMDVQFLITSPNP